MISLYFDPIYNPLVLLIRTYSSSSIGKIREPEFLNPYIHIIENLVKLYYLPSHPKSPPLNYLFF